MKLLLFLLAGFAAGVVVSWAYITSLKATLKIYRTYIGESTATRWPAKRRSLDSG